MERWESRGKEMEGESQDIMITVTSLSHAFGDKKVLDGVSFQVARGEIVGLLGPSGAGKSTLVNLLTGQIKPAAGEIRMGAWNGGSTEVSCGIMMDSCGLYERLSVLDNLRIFARLYRVPRERIEFLLERAELYAARKTPVGRLSKGMRSRVNFCRALLKEAGILFLDEPTGGLDPATTRKIQELILEQKACGTTIFLTTHNMQEAERLCDHILLLDDGRIVEQGRPQELCRKYNVDNQIAVVLKDGSRMLLPNAADGAERFSAWMREGKLVSVHSTEPDLEKVFLGLTGKELNV